MPSSYLTLVIIIDSLHKRALTQLLRELNLKGSVSGALVPPFSFEPDAAYLSGHYPEETDSGTHFWYKPGNLFQLCHSVLKSRIPFRFLYYFDTVRKKRPTDESFCRYPTIFDLLKNKGMHWVYLGASVSSAYSKDIWKALRQLDLQTTDLIMLFAGDLDAIGHKYGPNSGEYKVGVKKIGEFISNVLDYIQKPNQKIRTLIFGDHGMAEINRFIDIELPLKKLPITPVRDYIYFLDSTLARFWFFNEKARETITQALEPLKEGRIISKEDRVKYHINYPHSRFGELIWWADEGTLISPNFWQGHRSVKGMHGYRSEALDNHAGFVLIDSRMKDSITLKEPVEMVDIFATMIDMLELDMPEAAHGVSLYRWPKT